MSQWGRKVYPSWPSRHPVWTISAFFGAGAVLHAHACRAVSAELVICRAVLSAGVRAGGAGREPRRQRREERGSHFDPTPLHAVGAVNRTTAAAYWSAPRRSHNASAIG